jgi:hypothetical protein
LRNNSSVKNKKVSKSSSGIYIDKDFRQNVGKFFHPHLL